MTGCLGSGKQSVTAVTAVELAAAVAAIQIAQPPSHQLLYSVALFGCYTVLTAFFGDFASLSYAATLGLLL